MAGLFPVVGDVVEQRVICVLGNQVAMNIFHYGVGAVTTGGASLLEFSVAADALLGALYKACMCTSAQYHGVGMTNITTLRTIEYVTTTNAGNGANAGNPVPTQVRGLISYQGFAAGPANRGRQYIPFPWATAVSSTGDPSTTYITNLTALRTYLAATRVFVGAGGSTTCFPVIAHRPRTPSNWSTILQMFARTRFATQRRSGAYGRPNIAPW